MEIEEQEWYQEQKRQMEEVLEGLELSEKEERFIGWLARMETSSVESFCTIMAKARSQEKPK